MAATAHIVVVDDEPDLREMVQEYLVMNGYDVSVADGGPALRRLLARKPADLVLLDITMPGEDGLSIARQLRSQGPVGIIMVTAVSQTVDRIIGLEVGADDYVTKPFDLRELLARVKSVLRRTHKEAPPPRLDRLRIGNLTLDLQGRQLLDGTGQEIRLTSAEFDLLKAFCEHPRRVLSREQLLDLTSAGESEAFDRSIDVRVTRLRQKIETDPGKPQFIRTVRGAGYLFNPDGSG